MKLRRAKSEGVTAFLKRRSSVQVGPGTLLFSKDLRVEPPPKAPPIPTLKRVSCTKTVQGPRPYGRPSWLREATAHLREHYPADGVAASVLYALWGVGFDLPGVSQ